MTDRLDAFKAHQRATWEAGDYAITAEAIAEVGEPSRPEQRSSPG